MRASRVLAGLAGLLGLLVALLVTSTAHAEKALAESLFNKGKEAMKANDLQRACQLFAESQAQESSPGALIGLAECHARQGLTATAWAVFKDAAAQADREGNTGLAAKAHRRAHELEPDLSSISLNVQEPVTGLQISRDEVAIGAGAFGVAQPVDPGRHRIEASAPGYVSWSIEVEVGPRAKVAVRVPRLLPDQETAVESEPASAKLPAPTPARPPAPARPSAPARPARAAGSRTPAIALVAAGGALTIAGGVLGVLALGSYNRADEQCPAPHERCAGSTMDLRDTAELQANLSNAGLALGVVGLGVGALLFWQSGPERAERRVSVQAVPSGATFSLAERF